MANSKRKCKGCGEYFAADEMVKLPIGVFCSKSEAIAWALKASEKDKERRKSKVEKDTKEEIKRDRVRLKARKLELQPLSYFHRKAQSAFNAYIRARDAGNSCISCGRNTGCKMNAGHFRTVGASPETRYNEDNCFLQCERCNSFLSGSIDTYRPALIDKIGMERFEALTGYHKPIKWTREMIEEIESTYKKKLKELQQK